MAALGTRFPRSRAKAVNRMRLKDILWPWGAIDDLKQAVAVLESQVETESSRVETWRTICSRERDISANRRSECLSLHKEVSRLNDVLDNVSRIAENNQTTKRLEVLGELEDVKKKPDSNRAL